ncbi:hypothetical protein [Streptomyces tirandamycinicus]|uniref:Lipoprotein n=1 Tax=Streptomyces tirandamycinicus TaxID=2174846 RepID=A0A2S1SWM4_9ACTN|nr:hypothetical protein [Streptomyces tirandamycinicus]AWI30813.1 hypothetical protein DDW44_20045 [Streptomyces tirandamycinicus]
MTALPPGPAAPARRAALPVALCAALTAALAGCGEDPDAGTNGVGKLEATAIEKKAKTAADAAVAVRVAGTLVSKGGTYKLNMRLKKTGGVGSVTSKNSTFELLRVGEALYLKADAGFWVHADSDGGDGGAEPGEEDRAAAEKLDDKYVKVPQDDPAYKQLRGFTDMNVLLDGLLGLHGKLSKGDRSTIGGVRTIKIMGGGGNGGTLAVSLEGTPYPLQLDRAGDAGVLTLGDWGQDFPLEAPAKEETVDYGRQLPRDSP